MGNGWWGKNAVIFKNMLLSVCTLTLSSRCTDAGDILPLDSWTRGTTCCGLCGYGVLYFWWPLFIRGDCLTLDTACIFVILFEITSIRLFVKLKARLLKTQPCLQCLHACVHVSFFLSYEEHSASNTAGSVCSILHLRARLADSNSLWFSGLVVRSA